MNVSRALCLSITSGLVVACGVLIAVLIYMLGVTIADGFGVDVEQKYVVLKAIAGPYWLVAIVYVFPGVFDFIAAFVQNKCLYIFCCIITLICVIVMGLAIFIFGYPMTIVILVLYRLGKDCKDEGGSCMCMLAEDTSYSITPFKECSYMEDTVNLFMAVGVLIVLAWIFLLAAFIVTIVYACRFKQTSGTIYTPAQQPMLTH